MKQVLALVLVTLLGRACLQAAEPAIHGTFRFAISETLLSKNVTPAETQRAMSTWAAEVRRQVSSFVQFEMNIWSSSELIRKLKSGEGDGVVVSAMEYPLVANLIETGIMTNEAAPEGEEYLLLTHKDSGIQSLADLKGKRLVVYDHPKMNLAQVWLDMQLTNAKLGVTEGFFGSVTPNAKLNQTVLSVFFKTSDACLVAKRSLATMVELNPQLGVKLHTLSISPKLVPSVLVFRKNCDAQVKKEFQRGVAQLKTVAAGQQALALFDGTGVLPAESSVLKQSLELIAAHSRLAPARAGLGSK